jgi:hypothetical protein
MLSAKPLNRIIDMQKKAQGPIVFQDEPGNNVIPAASFLNSAR